MVGRVQCGSSRCETERSFFSRFLLSHHSIPSASLDPTSRYVLKVPTPTDHKPGYLVRLPSLREVGTHGILPIFLLLPPFLSSSFSPRPPSFSCSSSMTCQTAC
ncbi:hypothetical protein NCU17249 [Neurospora crassa OR74A]|uniref:Uncharacterized protein n=1 Tax=Neurospora crassa (strain ATCC 24698 / 74-OR23-1A / CBS 708.71 / DSM 1257 / FGSC 987) TaxID=367110 RepID=V5ILM3_NEUCR|nr:hypothetical protein NCU17249 [Neurospora crassa OR74A]ESA42004.1 hypothetical protein NCU17249 [Neurospora crassa OR74A]|eukprot:XP_011395376.1 hypothetical protein NCU17249 [Neurospora crassa OR74A]